MKFNLTNLDAGLNPEDARESDEEVDNPDVVNSDVFGTPMNIMEAPWLSYMTGAHPALQNIFNVPGTPMNIMEGFLKNEEEAPQPFQGVVFILRRGSMPR